MLQNGLGHLLQERAVRSRRFVDLFTGAGTVAAFVAQRCSVPVIATDLQNYSIILAEAVVGRTAPLDAATVWQKWHRAAKSLVGGHSPPELQKLTRARVESFRSWCADNSMPITRAYGGYYYSPYQACWIDAFRATLPEATSERNAALAALIQAGSKCAAAPGHTAQPFQPTRSAKPYLEEAWKKNIESVTRQCFERVSSTFALAQGAARLADANTFAETLGEGDLVFIDPPYSGVHYSRFYHVLETIALGDCGEVSGAGRYPSPEHRPRSSYSIKTESVDAVDDLLRTLSFVGAEAIVTFPDHECSNGLSGTAVREIAQRYFCVHEFFVKSTFSTLGGPKANEVQQPRRLARQKTRELVLVLQPSRSRELGCTAGARRNHPRVLPTVG